jgi:hypothetical protein
MHSGHDAVLVSETETYWGIYPSIVGVDVMGNPLRVFVRIGLPGIRADVSWAAQANPLCGVTFSLKASGVSAGRGIRSATMRV